ncbi:MAG: hypothetical protein VXZ72_02870 [Chlamydiota bacterium]|nr:hypothetical protein [Chlamydiota bacterium]
MPFHSEDLLGKITIELPKLPGGDSKIETLKHSLPLCDHIEEAETQISQTLLHLLNNINKPDFFLGGVIDWIKKVQSLPQGSEYRFSTFEYWLNTASELDEREQSELRGKIAGKWIPRPCYQALFPIGMGQRYPGPHIVSGHAAPDLDTTIASFWGWIDAFAARLGEGNHRWNLPRDCDPHHVEIDWLFYGPFGPHIFELADPHFSLAIVSQDIASQERVRYLNGKDRLSFAMDHEALILTNESGHYIGDWRPRDGSEVRYLTHAIHTLLLSLTSSWIEKLHNLFSQDTLSCDACTQSIDALLMLPLTSFPLIEEWFPHEQQHIHNTLIQFLKMEKGLSSSVESLLSALGVERQAIMQALTDELFPRKGPWPPTPIFQAIQQVVQQLNRAVTAFRQRSETLEGAYLIKSEVLGHTPHTLSHTASWEEMVQSMKNYSYLTVLRHPNHGKPLPLGIVEASSLKKGILGTVSLRDFCNREELHIGHGLEIISVMDHHRSDIQTQMPANIQIHDVQSANTLLAESALSINAPYQRASFSDRLEPPSDPSPPNMRHYLLEVSQYVAQHHQSPYYVSPRREYLELLHFLYAIFDDTDLLGKATPRDIHVVARLLNRLKSIARGKLTTLVDLSDLPQDTRFVKEAARLILQHPDCYSLYLPIYEKKKERFEEEIIQTLQQNKSTLFADTKLLKKCHRVGQIKCCAESAPLLALHREALISVWQQEAAELSASQPTLLLHLQMLSTLPSAKDIFHGRTPQYSHHDSLWIWIPDRQEAERQLRRFLLNFQHHPSLPSLDVKATFIGPQQRSLSRLLQESFLDIAHSFDSLSTPYSLIILNYGAGSLNSRKGSITPFLPS